MASVCLAALARLLLLALLLSRGTCSIITFTGNVVADFSSGDAGVYVAQGSQSSHPTFYGASTGWSMNDVRFAYDITTDTAFFGAWAGWGPDRDK